MTIQDAAKEALMVQDACNLSGVVHSFSRILSDVLWPEANRIGEGTTWVNRHPISQMFAEKIASLAKVRGIDSHSSDVVFKAFGECERISRGE